MIIALNNKCNLTKEEFITYQEELSTIKSSSTLILCPSNIYLTSVTLTNFSLGAQNVSSYELGPHTGEVSATQLKSLGVKYAIVGHSERRAEEKESSDFINLKVKNLFAKAIIPIMCIGETKEERLAGTYKDALRNELVEGTKDLSPLEKDQLIIAYEPIWSIGTGLIPKKEEIEGVNALIKELLPNTKILYGGSANEENISFLKTISSIDGYLLGGLSLKPQKLQDFINLLENKN